jgi:tetratricopeptide (TPR) repeat protein
MRFLPRRASVVTRGLAVVALSICSAFSTCSRSARADAIADAETLFRRAKALMAENKAEEACPLFKESYRLDPGQGTLLNLALCHEQTGRVASAWGEFRAVEQQARLAVPPRTDRAEMARLHAEKLEPRVARIEIIVAPDVRVTGFVVKIDGEEKAPALWSGVPADPGPHTIEVSAPHKKSRAIDARIDGVRPLVSVKIAPLEEAPAPVESAATGAADLDKAEQYASNRARRTTGYVVGAIGLTTLAASAVFGIAAIINDDDAKKCSPCAVGPDADASNRATDRALVFANVSNVTLPIGLLGTALGAYLVLSAGPTSKVSLQPSVSTRTAGLDVRAEW